MSKENVSVSSLKITEGKVVALKFHLESSQRSKFGYFKLDEIAPRMIETKVLLENVE